MATNKTLTPTNVTIQIPEFTDQPDQRVNSNCIDKEADAINALNGKTIQNTESFSSLSTFKTFFANMTVGKAVNIITSSEVSTAISGSTYMCSGIATKIDSSFVDINWVRGDSSVGSTRYNITSQTFSINDINGKITYQDFTCNMASYSGATKGDLITALNTTKDITLSGYTPIAITMTDFPSTTYNVGYMISSNSALIRCYAVATAANATVVKFRVMYIKT